MRPLTFFLSILPLTVMLPLLTSCGGPATSSAQLSVSPSFISTSPFSGGFIVVGESSTGKKFSMSIVGSNESKVSLDKGIWKFSAVGWDGGASDKPFEGSTQCGSVSNIDLSADTATVEIKVDAATCLTANTISEVNIKSLSPVACDIFYNYSAPTNTFTALSPSFSPSFCNSLPNAYRSEFKQYRIQSMNILNGVQSPGFISECKSLSTPTPLNVPMLKVPLLVKFFKEESDCNNNRLAQNYYFGEGISAGSPNFDQLLSSSGTHLLLSSSRTKRGKSPFMNEIPRITCGSNGSYAECVPEPTLNAHVNVRFHSDHYNDQTILKGINPLVSNCLPTVLGASKYFSTDTCKVEEREVSIQPYRNQLTCQANPFYSGPFTIKDIYHRNGKTYILRYQNSPTFKDFVAVYSKTGKLLADYEIGSTQYEEIAVSNDGSKIVLINATDAYTISIAANGLPSGVVRSGKGGSQVEINLEGTYFFVASNADVKSYGFSSVALVDTKTVASDVLSMSFGKNGYLYVTDTTNKNLYKSMVSNTGVIADLSTIMTNFSAIPVTEITAADNGKLYLYAAPSYYSYNGTLSSQYDISANTGTPVGMAVIDNKVFFAEANELNAYLDFTSTLVSAKGNCSESLSIALGDVTKTVFFESIQDQPLLPIFEDGINLIGRNTFSNTDKPFYYFQSLSHHGDGIRTGGKLERIQEMLSPEAIGGLLSNFATCADVKAAATAAVPFSKTIVLVEESLNKQMNIIVSLAPTTEVINTFICDDSDPNSAGCAGSKYDFVINFSHNDGERREKNRIKLKCGKQLGTFESAELEYLPTSETRKELLVWNTSSDVKARFESYSLDQDTMKRAEVIRLEKADTNLIKSRTVQVELNGLNKSGSVSQYEISSNSVLTSRFHLGDTLVNFNAGGVTTLPGTSYSFDDIALNESFASTPAIAEAKSYSTISGISIYGTTSSGGYFGSISYPYTSLLIEHSISGLNIDDPSHPLVLGPTDTGAVFELNP